MTIRDAGEKEWVRSPLVPLCTGILIGLLVSLIIKARGLGAFIIVGSLVGICDGVHSLIFRLYYPKKREPTSPSLPHQPQ